MKSYNTEHWQPTDMHCFLFGGFNVNEVFKINADWSLNMEI